MTYTCGSFSNVFWLEDLSLLLGASHRHLRPLDSWRRDHSIAFLKTAVCLPHLSVILFLPHCSRLGQVIKSQYNLHERVCLCCVETRVGKPRPVTVHHVVSASLLNVSITNHNLCLVTLLIEVETNWHFGRLRSFGSISWVLQLRHWLCPEPRRSEWSWRAPGSPTTVAR